MEIRLKKTFTNCFEDVFRTGTEQPGFFYLDMGPNRSSFLLREVMVEMKQSLSELAKNRFHKTLNYQWLGRFDQQANTRYHLDNAANQSFLMLGYEPTAIKSELYIADYVKFSHDNGIEPAEYFEKFNPIFTDNETILKPYSTKITPFPKESFQIVVINNSNSQPECDTLGVLHMAKMINPDSDKSRIVNSMMLNMVSVGKEEQQQEIEERFLTTDHVSK